jgi:transposase-like protein
MTDRSHSTTRQIWADRIDRFEQASQSVAEFCAAEGVSAASFYQWRRKLRPKISTTTALARFVPVGLPEEPHTEPATVMSVELPGGVRIRFEVNERKMPQP